MPTLELKTKDRLFYSIVENDIIYLDELKGLLGNDFFIRQNLVIKSTSTGGFKIVLRTIKGDTFTVIFNGIHYSYIKNDNDKFCGHTLSREEVIDFWMSDLAGSEVISYESDPVSMLSEILYIFDNYDDFIGIEFLKRSLEWVRKKKELVHDISLLIDKSAIPEAEALIADLRANYGPDTTEATRLETLIAFINAN